MAIAFAMFVIPAVVSAAGGFVDVDDTSLFKADINWLAASGVTKGCNPPTNDKFCPQSTVTREQMAAFMHRLAANKVVDAKTAVTADTAKNADNADNATNATNATNADDASKLEGKTAAELSSIAASAVADLIFPGGASTSIGSLTGFDVPANGGVITATAVGFAGMESDVNFGVAWIEIDGTGACDMPELPIGFSFWETITTAFNVGTFTASAAKAVPAGTHRIDLCTAGYAATNSTGIAARLNVVWSPVASGAGVASVSGGQTLDDIFASYAGVLDN